MNPQQTVDGVGGKSITVAADQTWYDSADGMIHVALADGSEVKFEPDAVGKAYVRACGETIRGRAKLQRWMVGS